MRYDRWVRYALTISGVGPQRTTIRVDDGLLCVKLGRAFHMVVALQDIKSARLLPRKSPIVWAIGIHQTGDSWLINGSRDGIVELTFAGPIKPKKVPMGPLFGGPVRALYLGLAEPEDFITALKSQV